MRSLVFAFPHPVGDVLPVVDGPRSSVRSSRQDATSAEPVATAVEGDRFTFEDWYAFRAERQAQRAGRAAAAERSVEGDVVPKQAMLIGLAAATFLAFLAGVVDRQDVWVAERDGRIAGFLALDGDLGTLFYVDPETDATERLAALTDTWAEGDHEIVAAEDPAWERVGHLRA